LEERVGRGFALFANVLLLLLSRQFYFLWFYYHLTVDGISWVFSLFSFLCPSFWIVIVHKERAHAHLVATDRTLSERTAVRHLTQTMVNNTI
jgi:hypothetical protein